MVNKKDKGNKSSGSRPKNAEKKTPSAKKKTPKNVLQFENLISGFSGALISTAEEKLEKELNNWLRKFVEFLRVDRCVVNEFLEDKKTVHRLLNYTVPELDIEPVPDTYQPPEGVIKNLNKGIIVKAEKIPEDLPESFRGGIIEKTHTKSIVIAPLIAENRVIGSLLFSSFRKRRRWSDDIIRRVKFIGEIIANAILRMRSQENLLKVEEKYSTILKNASVGFWISNFGTASIIDVNDEYCRMSGYSREELLSKKIWEIDAFLSPDKVKKEGRNLDRSGSNHHVTKHIRKDGSLFDVEVSSNLYEKDGVVCSFMRDITDLNLARKELEERLEFEEIISEFSAALISPDDFKGELNRWVKLFVEHLRVDRGVVIEHHAESKSVKVLMQYSVPEVDITPLEDLYNIPEDEIREFEKGMFLRAEKIPEDLPEILRGGMIEQDNTKSVIIVPLSSGSRAIGSLTFATYRKERKWSDDIVRRIKLIGEIIANAFLRKRSHENLIKETEQRKILEERYSSIIKSANIGFWISDRDRNILLVNDEYCRMSGYSRDELLLRKIPDIDISFDSENKKITEEILGIGASHHEVIHRKKDGSMMELDVSSTLLESESLLFSFMRDVTELNKTRREQEERLKFEELLSEFSAALINIEPDLIYDELNKWLKKFVEMLQVDRGIVNEHLYEENMIHLLLNYCVPEFDIPLTPYHQIPGGVREDFIKGISVIAEKIPDDLPQGLRGGLVEKENAKSVIIVPIIASNEVIGNLTFLSYRKARKWPDELVRRIKTIGEIMANAIMRERSYKNLLEETERRKRMEERHSVILANANVGFIIGDFDSNILDVNDEYCRMSGYSRDEILSMKIYDLQLPMDSTELNRISDDVSNIGATHHEATHKKKDGSLIEVDVSTTVLGENLFSSFMRDITELNQAKREREERLKFEEVISEFSTALINIKPGSIYNELEKWLEKFTGLIDSDRGAINEYSHDQRILYNLIQYSVPGVHVPIPDVRKTPEGEIAELEKGIIRVEKIPEDMPQMFLGSFFEKSDAKSLIIVPLFTGSRVFGNLAFTNYGKERKWSDELIRRIRLIAEIVGNAIMRLRSHEALLDEMERRHMLEEKYTSIIKNASVGFTISDENQNILDANDEYCRMSGYTFDELIKMKISDIDYSESTEKVDDDIAKTIGGEGGILHHQSKHIRKDGSLFDVDIHSQYSESEGFFFSFVRDVTELNRARRELEERLKFEELTSEFSAALIKIELDDINEELYKWLIKFVEFLNVDRGMVYEYEVDNNSLISLVSYTSPDIGGAPAEKILIAPEKVMDFYISGKTLLAEKIPDDLPLEFRGWIIEEHNTKSVVVVPLTAGNQVLGNITFASYRKERKWSDELVRRIKLIGEIIANAVSRKRSSDALIAEMDRRQQLEERYTSVIKTANVGFWISDTNQNILVVNDEYCRMSGYSSDELVKMKISDIDFSRDPEKVDRDGMESIAAGSTHRESKHVRKDGSIFDVDISSNFLPGEGLFFSFTRDITELNKAREDLEERLKFEELTSEFSAALINLELDNIDLELTPWIEKFVEFLKVERGIISEYDYEKGCINVISTYTDPAVDVPPTEISHRAPEPVMQKLAQGTVLKIERIPEDLPPIFNEGIINGHNTKSIVIVPLSAENQIIGNLTFATYTKEYKWSDEFLRRVRLIGEIIANAILRKRSSNALIEEIKSRHMVEEKYTSIIKNASVGFTISDNDQNILDVNDEYCRMSGYTYDELIKMKISDIDYSKSTDKVDDDITKTIEGEGGIFHHQSRHIRKDGTIFDVDVHSQYSEKEGCFFSFVRDITELNNARRDLEERLKFEELVSEFSAALINIEPDEIKNELQNWIGKIVNLLDVDMGIVNEYINEQKNVMLFLHYTVPGLSLPVDKIRKTQTGFIRLLEKGVMRAERIPEDLPIPLRDGLVEKHNTKSLIVAPLLTGNRVFGNLTFACYKKERSWSDELVRRIKLVSEIIGNAILRLRSFEILNQAQKELEERLEFEELVSDFSAALVDINLDSISEELHKWIIKFVRFLDVDRGIINEFQYDEKAVNALVSYSVPDVDAPPHEKHYIWPDKVMTEFANGLVIRAEKIPEDLPPVFHGWMIEDHNTKSLVVVPLSAGNHVIGNLTFASYREERKWSDELVRRIKLIGEIIANAILRKRSSDALIAEMERRRQLEERYTSIIKNANVGFMISDLNQNIMVVNDEYCRMSGYSRDELKKMRISDIDFSDDPDKVEKDVGITVDDGLYYHQTRHIHKSGRIYDVEVNSKFMEEENIVFSFVRDVTELNKARRELEERLKFEELVSEFSASLINVKIANIKDELNIWLGRFARFLNVDKCCLGEYEDDYQWYRYISTYLNPELDPQPPPFPSEPVHPYGFTEYLKKGETIILEDLYKGQPRFPDPLMQKLKEDGTRSILMLPLVAGDVLLGSMLISSMTGERTWPQHLVRELRLVAEIFANALMRDKRDLELDNYRRDLEKMVDERTFELREAQKELVLSEKMATLGRLTATVSHELRNPLGTIRSSVFSVQRRLKEPNEKVATALDRAERNIKRCDIIIDELLNYSRAHDLKLEPTPIDAWIDEVIEEAGPPSGISIKKDYASGATINMDQERFRRCMVNILTNSYQSIEEKGADEPGYVIIQTRQDMNNLIIEISDNGVGFDMADKSRLFEPLYSTKTYGVGLGIPITKQIIEQHGWGMDITGEPQKGASIIITIPL